MSTKCSTPPRAIAKLSREFTELHEGLKPTSFSCEPYHTPEKPIRSAGRVVQIDYDKLIPQGKQWYYHPIVSKSQPILGFDRRGIPVVYAGKIHVTTRGIEDVLPARQHAEHIPATPKTLSVFGRIREIRYKPWNARRTETWKPSRPLELAHDERGELHVLGVVSGEGKMKHRKHHRGSRSRRNPVEFTGDKSGKSAFRAVIPALAIGVGGAIVGGLADSLLSKGKDSKQPVSAMNPPRFSGYKRAAIEGGAGVGLAIIAHLAKAPPIVTLAVASGPIAVGSKTAFDTYRAQQAQNSTQTGTPPGQTGANQGGAALMPGGLPQSYNAVSRSVCGVR